MTSDMLYIAVCELMRQAQQVMVLNADFCCLDLPQIGAVVSQNCSFSKLHLRPFYYCCLRRERERAGESGRERERAGETERADTLCVLWEASFVQNIVVPSSFRFWSHWRLQGNAEAQVYSKRAHTVYVHSTCMHTRYIRYARCAQYAQFTLDIDFTLHYVRSYCQVHCSVTKAFRKIHKMKQVAPITF